MKKGKLDKRSEHKEWFRNFDRTKKSTELVEVIFNQDTGHHFLTTKVKKRVRNIPIKKFERLRKEMEPFVRFVSYFARRKNNCHLLKQNNNKNYAIIERK